VPSLSWCQDSPDFGKLVTEAATPLLNAPEPVSSQARNLLRVFKNELTVISALSTDSSEKAAKAMADKQAEVDAAKDRFDAEKKQEFAIAVSSFSAGVIALEILTLVFRK
jgi:hypothetical protein